jgi:hypothetical protein
MFRSRTLKLGIFVGLLIALSIVRAVVMGAGQAHPFPTTLSSTGWVWGHTADTPNTSNNY